MIASATSMMALRWAMTMTVRPSSRMVVMARTTVFSLTASRWAVGSSRMTICEWAARARVSARRWR